MEFKVSIKNLPQIRAAFSRAPQLMSKRFKVALSKSALTVQRESMIRTPVDTGRLRSSHGFSLSGAGLGMSATVMTGYKVPVNYAVFVHEGTRFMRARPFMKEGADASQHQIEQFFKEATQDGLDEIGRMV